MRDGPSSRGPAQPDGAGRGTPRHELDYPDVVMPELSDIRCRRGDCWCARSPGWSQKDRYGITGNDIWAKVGTLAFHRWASFGWHLGCAGGGDARSCWRW